MDKILRVLSPMSFYVVVVVVPHRTEREGRTRSEVTCNKDSEHL